MERQTFNLLLVNGDSTHADWLEKLLNESDEQQFNQQQVKQIDSAINALCQNIFDAVIINLSSTDNIVFNIIKVIKQKAPQLAMIVVTNTDNSELAVELMLQGVQDYLIKEQLSSKRLTRSIQCAIARQHREFNTSQQALMKKMLDRIRNSIELEGILQTTAEIVQQFLHSDQVLIYRCEAGQSTENTTVYSSTSVEADRQRIEQFIRAINFSSLHSILSESTSVRSVKDTWDKVPKEFPVLEPDLVRSYLILPIWLKESVDYVYDDLTSPMIKSTVSHNRDEGLWGMLVAYNLSKTRQWQDWEINFVQRLTTQVTQAIYQSQLCCRLQIANQKLQQLAILDGLTGIANRRYFDLVLDKEWQRLAREQQPLSLILCDVDYFKAYNDTYGHQQGDFCLQQIAQILQQSTRRPADLAARYGGEEFALILPNTDAPGAVFLAHKIVRKLANQPIPHLKSKINDFVTLSIGVTTKIPHAKKPSSTIIETADNLLYRAKQAGRNQLAVDNWLTSSQKA